MIHDLLSMIDGGCTCGEAQALTLTHLANIREKIADLRRLEQSLTDVASQCEGGAVPKCPVIDVLFDQRD